MSGFCATLVGNGLGRFAFTPLIPALIVAGWFSPSSTFYLQAANFGGYLIGAFAGRYVPARIRVGGLRAMMVFATASLFACAWPYSFSWFAGWRFASGLSGGFLIVLTAAEVLPNVPLRTAGLVGGILFSGVAVGIAASGTVVPLLLQLGLHGTWLALGASSLVFTAIAWKGWPGVGRPIAQQAHTGAVVARSESNDLVLMSLYVEYALVAVALVPHMVFLVDFIARGLDRGLAIGSLYWALFGLSAMVGSLLFGWLGDRVGFRSALRLVLAIETIALLIPTFLSSTFPLVLSTILVGGFVPGSSTLVLGCLQQLTRRTGNRHQAAWSIATVSFGLGQATAAYLFTWLFAITGSYMLLFACAAFALMVALTIDLIANPKFPALSDQAPDQVTGR